MWHDKFCKTKLFSDLFAELSLDPHCLRVSSLLSRHFRPLVDPSYISFLLLSRPAPLGSETSSYKVQSGAEEGARTSSVLSEPNAERALGPAWLLFFGWFLTIFRLRTPLSI